MQHPYLDSSRVRETTDAAPTWALDGVMQEWKNPRGDGGEYTRGVSKEIYCRDKRVQRKTRVKSGSGNLHQQKYL